MCIIFESLVSARLIYILPYLILVHMPQVIVNYAWIFGMKTAPQRVLECTPEVSEPLELLSCRCCHLVIHIRPEMWRLDER